MCACSVYTYCAMSILECALSIPQHATTCSAMFEPSDRLQGSCCNERNGTGGVSVSLAFCIYVCAHLCVCMHPCASLTLTYTPKLLLFPP